PSSPSPGAQHDSIKAALRASGDDGTRSILDIEKTGNELRTRVAFQLPDDYLVSLYGTATPTREMVENVDFLDAVDRGQCVYCTIYKNGEPDEFVFAGYSFD
ncbi:MAG TPA: hypothetical protein VJS64_10375, partial [Pyrinomonadaceae bacterium]|nr:hypothetical protein [Pyrinomonadaceae bacterium]